MTDAERTEVEAASATTSPTPPVPAAPAPEPWAVTSEDARQLAIARLLAAGRHWLRPAGGSP